MNFTLPILALIFGLHYGAIWTILLIALALAIRFLPSAIVLEVIRRLIFTAMQN